ncbi:class I SAM-dependent methyltransferase [Aliiglaciecola sp.]|nr:class I SAM-dependent methyltransferase [Aliiglaciecola sp.]
MKCRHCKKKLEYTFADLGYAPPSNAYRRLEEIDQPEATFPLVVKVCHHCWLVQTQDFVAANEMFSPDYAYFSSVSSGWLKHAKSYVEMITSKLNLGKDNFVIEVASNDGYLLKNFVNLGIPCLGIEPTEETADKARELGIPVMKKFFTEDLANSLSSEGKQADLVIGNNVLAHVPDINDFVKGLEHVLKEDGVVTMEFPHLLRLIEHCQFDTIYHEHFSYLSLSVVQRIFSHSGLKVFDVEELTTHGGSLRVYACKKSSPRNASSNVNLIIQSERDNGLQELTTYLSFQRKIDNVTEGLVDFLCTQQKAGKTVIGYGAAAKGNTLLNYADIKPDLLPAICDAAPSKQRKYMPGSNIPIYSPRYLEDQSPDFILILPWNIKQEVKQQLSFLKNTAFVTAISKLEID